VQREAALEAESQLILGLPGEAGSSMTVDYLIAFFGGAIITMMCSMKSMSRGVRLQQDVLERGLLAQGRVIRLWQPPLAAFTRIYFEFQPGGAEHSIRTCHVDRRGAGEWAASLPRVGTSVAVRYLPEKPTRAVIVKLVSRLMK
jgi:hypothetical protein